MILPDFGYGGAERSFSKLSVELAKHFEVVVVVFNLSLNQVYPVGGKVLSLGVEKSNTLVRKLINFFRRINRLREIKKEEKPDVSISFLEGADIINLISKDNEVVICSIRGSKLYDQNIKGLSRYLKVKIIWPWLYSKADSIVAVNNGIRDEIQSIIGKKSKKKLIVSHSSDNKYQAPQKSNQNHEILNQLFSTNSSVLCSVGRLAPEKGFHLFLPVYKRLLENNKSLKYVIIGDGNYQEDIINVCNRLNLNVFTSLKEFKLTYDVYLLGYIANPIPLISRSRFFIFPSTHEGWPNVLAEAIEANIPSLISDCPYGPREMLFPAIPYNKDINYPAENGSAILLPNLLNSRLAKEYWYKAANDNLEFKNNASKPKLDSTKDLLTWKDIISKYVI